VHANATLTPRGRLALADASSMTTGRFVELGNGFRRRRRPLAAGRLVTGRFRLVVTRWKRCRIGPVDRIAAHIRPTGLRFARSCICAASAVGGRR
jgi:hypothetical protein